MKNIQYIIFAVALINCRGPEYNEKWSRTIVKQEATQMLYDYHKAIAKDGLSAEFQYLDHSADFFWVPPGYSSKLNYDSVQKILIENDKSISSIQLEWDTLEVFPLSEEIASYTGIVRSKMKDTTGHSSETAIIESGTLIKRTDGWKLLSGQSAVLADKAPH